MKLETNQKNMAKILGVTTRTIRNLEDEGIFEQLESGLYSIPSVVQSYLEYKISSVPGNSDMMAERQRLVRITADRKDLQLQREKGDLLRADRAMAVWGAVCQSIRAKLLVIPTKVAPLVMPMKTIPEIKDRIETAIYEVLSEISNPDLEELARNDGVRAHLGYGKTTSPPKSKPMGRRKTSSKPGK